MMVKFGTLYRKSFGNLRIRRGDKRRNVDVKNIEYQKPDRQIGLDEAIKKEQKRKEDMKIKKDKIRAERIKKLRSAISRLQSD